jgi:hypothetical protein
MDYADLFLCQIELSALIELAIDKDILLTIITQNHQQARDNCSKVGTLVTYETSDESRYLIQNFFPVAEYIRYLNE